MIRSLYTRILVWFWLANAAVTLSILGLTLISGAQPLGRRWLAASLDLYAQTATDVYRSGGAAALNAYLDRIQSSVSMRAVLVGPSGETVSSRALPSGSLSLIDQVRATGKPRFRFGLTWLGVSIVHTPQGDYVFLAQVDALRRFSRQVGAGGLGGQGVGGYARRMPSLLGAGAQYYGAHQDAAKRSPLPGGGRSVGARLAQNSAKKR